MFYIVRNAPNDGREINFLIHGDNLPYYSLKTKNNNFKVIKI